MSYIEPGDAVVLIHRKKHKKLCIRIKSGEKIHTQWGIITADDIIGKTPGDIVRSHLGDEFVVFKALLYEKIEHSRLFKYVTQIVRPRDWGLIISFSNIRPGSRVVEIGTGSGAFTAFLCEIVKPDGFVYSYERLAERANVAIQNLQQLNIPKIYEIKVRDPAKDGVDEKDVDAVFVDIPEPWTVVWTAYDALIPGGIFIAYVPTFNQIEKLLSELNKFKFFDIRIIDHFYREIQPIRTAIRPLLKSYVFSAFIIFARKSSVANCF